MAEKKQEAKPSTALVDPPKSEADKLRDAGTPVQTVGVAPLPTGDPSSIPGLSAGSIPPKREDVQKDLESADKERKEQEKKQEQEQKKQESHAATHTATAHK